MNNQWLDHSACILGNSYRDSFSLKRTTLAGIVWWTSSKALMVSLGCFLVTTLTGLTTIFSEDLISLTIKPRGWLRVEETVKQQILDILCSSKGEDIGCSSVRINTDTLSRWISTFKFYSIWAIYLYPVLSCCLQFFVVPNYIHCYAWHCPSNPS